MSIDSPNPAMRLISPPRPPSPPRSIPPQDDFRRPPSVPPPSHNLPQMRLYENTSSFRGPPSNYDGRRSRGPPQPPMMRPTPQVGECLGSRGSQMSFQVHPDPHTLRKPGLF